MHIQRPPLRVSTSFTIILAVAQATLSLPAHAAHSPPLKREPPYRAEPQGRGTMGLILSCLITLTLCVWTAIHLNINVDPSPGKKLRRKALWLFIGLFAPELVLWAAFEQWRNARAILRFLKNESMAATDEENGQCLEFKKDSVEEDFGLESAFFAVMGGYTLGPWKTSRGGLLTLTPKGLIYLLSEGMIIPSDLAKLKGDILDKGKADFLAKFVVCAQALWMVVQCIFRKCVGLPTTFIELNVVIHVICTVAMYGFWWEKPLDVGQPLTLRAVDRGFCALAYASSHQYLKIRLSERSPGPELVPMAAHEQSDGLPSSSRVVGPPCSKIPNNNTDLSVTGSPYPLEKDIDTVLNKIIRRERKADGQVMIFRGQYLVHSEKGFRLTIEGREMFHVNNTELEIFAAAADALRTPNFQHLGVRDFSSHSYPLGIKIGEGTLFVEESNNLEVRGSVAQAKSGLAHPIMILGYLSLFYGASHASVWNGSFPSQAELWLWRLSCIFVGVVVPICAIQQSLLEYYKTHNSRLNVGGKWLVRFNKWTDDIDQHWLGSLFLLFFYSFNLLFIAGLSIGYVMARLYFVIESFVSVRCLPLGAYETHRWEKLWPHL
ncbi:hypothetical protein P167DRAFT_512310 [Morchella conica CCBAS932]|uniref:Uncharacterized protein n=1 Tax=Morchella conica CCBAS932 TaxID=1392247 RepID=A0A3N4KGC4_9PEZI|nr:hypothetical protein P167DRAFT_512310 [Morchella conica CCBAS932]